MTKLIIMIPCLNEEETLATTLAALPKKVKGFNKVETLIIDDGSTDKTVEIAKKAGVDHIVSHSYNMGLARAFSTGLSKALSVGADVIVNTDGDNQYEADDIEKLVQPILDNEALIVIGSRDIKKVSDFSWAKKVLQRLGSYVIRIISGTNVEDAASGFRAIHKQAAKEIYIHTNYTYTIEMIIQAGFKNIPIKSVPIRVNPVTRPSRLLKNSMHYIFRQAVSIAIIFILYKPLKLFLIAALLAGSIGAVTGIRFLYFFSIGDGDGHVQSLILATIMTITAVVSIFTGIICESNAKNRNLLEKIESKKQE